MKKRNVLTMALALVLVAVLSVGATLAYLTATDDKVTNTFQFADMTVTLTEEQPEKTPDGQEKIDPIKDDKGNVTGYAYTNVVPGQDLNKKPEISTETSVPAYVFVRVSGFEEGKMTTTTINSQWTAIDGTTDNLGNGIYYRATNPVKGDEGKLGAIFTTVTVADVAVSKDVQATLNNIEIDVYEIQQAGFDDINEAYEQVVASTGWTNPKTTPTTPAA